MYWANVRPHFFLLNFTLLGIFSIFFSSLWAHKHTACFVTMYIYTTHSMFLLYKSMKTLSVAHNVYHCKSQINKSTFSSNANTKATATRKMGNKLKERPCANECQFQTVHINMQSVCICMYIVDCF